MADNKLDAIVHKSVEHQPTFIKDGIQPTLFEAIGGVPALNTFLVYASSMDRAGWEFTSDDLPGGHYVLWADPMTKPAPAQARLISYEQATHHRKPAQDHPGAFRSFFQAHGAATTPHPRNNP